MPTYDFMCPAGGDHPDYEVFCSITAKEAGTHPCPVCATPGRQIHTTAPFLNNSEVRILDYPGSKRLKAGYVHSHGQKPVSKTSVGYGGVVQPSSAPKHPIVDMVRPDPLRFRKPTSGL